MEPGENCRRESEKQCSGCGLCVRECPGGALTLLGRSASIDEIMQIVLRDRFYYEQTGGGLALSGGEPTAQPDFALALLAAAKELGIHTAMETSGAVPTEIFARFIGKCDLYLFDIKASEKQYAELTGGDPKHIFSNLRALFDAGCRIVLRVPMVQGKNVDAEFAKLLEELTRLPNVEAVELLTFHDMGRGKAAMIGETEADWNAMSSDVPPEMARLFAAIPKLRCKSTGFQLN